jgi:Ni,Fe-hydrogenase III small subunit/ferredoxin-like protein FixX
MRKLLQKALRTGMVTEDYFMTPVAARYRGRIDISDSQCDDCRQCIDSCPTQALVLQSGRLLVDDKACLFCGACVAACEKQTIQHSLHYEMAKLQGRIVDETGIKLANRIRKMFRRSLAIRHVDVGSCNACDFEMAALSSPVYDLSQYGIEFVASPRHADMLMVTGVVTKNLRRALEITYQATPTPKLVMAVGACACSGRVFGDTYAVEGPVDGIIPVDITIPGCPPRPQALLNGLMMALDRL